MKESKQDDQVTKEVKPVVDVNADIAAIKKILRDYESELNAGDFDSWLSLWTDDGVRMPPDATTRIGVAQITEELKPIFDQFTFDIKITSIEDAKIFGDIGITRCSFNVAITPKAGGEKVTVLSNGKALTISKKQLDGSWKIIYDCFNSNIPPEQ
jgi:uncharacterized protein (TIGR02246 family)